MKIRFLEDVNTKLVHGTRGEIADLPDELALDLERHGQAEAVLDDASDSHPEHKAKAASAHHHKPEKSEEHATKHKR